MKEIIIDDDGIPCYNVDKILFFPKKEIFELLERPKMFKIRLKKIYINLRIGFFKAKHPWAFKLYENYSKVRFFKGFLICFKKNKKHLKVILKDTKIRSLLEIILQESKEINSINILYQRPFFLGFPRGKYRKAGWLAK